MWKAYLTILSYAIISSLIAFFLFFPRPAPEISGVPLGYYLIFLAVLASKSFIDITSWRLRCFFISKISSFYNLKGDLSRLIKYIGIFSFPLIIATLSLFLILFDVIGISLFLAVSSTMVALMYMLFLETIRFVYGITWKRGLIILIISEVILLGIGSIIIVVFYLNNLNIIEFLSSLGQYT